MGMTSFLATLPAWLVVRARGLVNLLAGRPAHRSGLTVPCGGGCGDLTPHDAHLAVGALTYLRGRR